MSTYLFTIEVDDEDADRAQAEFPSLFPKKFPEEYTEEDLVHLLAALQHRHFKLVEVAVK